MVRRIETRASDRLGYRDGSANATLAENQGLLLVLTPQGSQLPVASSRRSSVLSWPLQALDTPVYIPTHAHVISKPTNPTQTVKAYRGTGC